MADTPADSSSDAPADTTAETAAAASTGAPEGEAADIASAETPPPESGGADTAARTDDSGAAPAATATTEAAAETSAAPEPKPVVIPQALRGCVDKIHETIHNDLDDRELVKVLKKHVRQLKEWDQWSEHARNAYAHLIAAEIIHSKAASICIDNGIEFERTGKAEYEHLLRAVQKRTPR